MNAIQKVIVITGTSSGVGLSLAVKLAKQNHRVYATMRNLSKKDKLVSLAAQENVTVNVKALDVQDSSSITQCIKEIIQKEGRIDCLVNNAGAGFIRSTEQATEEDIQWVMDVNFFGMVRCVKAVLPFMREARNGQIINISSVGGLVGQPFNELYCAAKFAQEGYTESMATYIQPNFNIRFSLVEPGGIRSEFASSILKQVEQSGGMYQDDYLPILNQYVQGSGSRTDSGAYQTPDEVAEVIVDCINNENPPLRIRTSQWANDFCQLKTNADPDGNLQTKKVIKQMLGD